MIINIKKFIPLTCLLLSATANATITCPPASLIKAAIFTSALVYQEGTDLWELISAPFHHAGITWNLSYGLSITGATTEQDAIRLGQARFKEDRIIIQDPPADPIPGYVLCDYTPTGMPYWISAVSPPGM